MAWTDKDRWFYECIKNGRGKLGDPITWHLLDSQARAHFGQEFLFEMNDILRKLLAAGCVRFADDKETTYEVVSDLV